MTIQAFKPDSREQWLSGRRKTIGASEIAALFGVHSYMTAFELFLIKTGKYTKGFDSTVINDDSIILPPTERGNFLEEKALELCGKLRPEWRIVSNQIPGGVVYIDQERGLSSTPDALIYEDLKPGYGSLQIKNIEPMIFKFKWQDDNGNIDVPVDVAIQAMQDAVMSGADRAYVGVMTVGFEVQFRLFEITILPDLIDNITIKAAEFWRRVEENDPYAPDYARDGEVLAGLYPVKPGTKIDLSTNNRIGELCQQKGEWTRRGTNAERALETLNAEIIEMMQGAEVALHPAFNITRKITKRKEITIAACEFPVLRVTNKKAKDGEE